MPTRFDGVPRERTIVTASIYYHTTCITTNSSDNLIRQAIVRAVSR